MSGQEASTPAAVVYQFAAFCGNDAGLSLEKLANARSPLRKFHTNSSGLSSEHNLERGRISSQDAFPGTC